MLKVGPEQEKKKFFKLEL